MKALAGLRRSSSGLLIGFFRRCLDQDLLAGDAAYDGGVVHVLHVDEGVGFFDDMLIAVYVAIEFEFLVLS